MCCFFEEKKQCAVTVACHVIPASGRLVDVDIPELSESPWPGFDIFLNQHGTGAADSEGIRPETDTGNG